MSSILRGSRLLLAPARARSAAAATAAGAPPPPEGTAAKTKAKAKAKAKANPKERSSNTGRLTGIQKPQQVSPSLASFLGASESSRANAVKLTWAYIKLHNLQNPENKQEINCDNKLKMLFDGRDKINFLEVSKFLGPHFVKTQ